jgi:phage portal protein BeeE
MTRFTFFQTLMNHVLSRGNAFAEILRNNGSLKPAELALMDPDDTMPGWSADGKRKVYKSRRTEQTWDQADIFHIPGLGYDGLSGYNVVDFAKQAIGLDLAAEQYGAAWFGAGGRPSGHLKYPGKLDPDQADNVRTTWKQRDVLDVNAGLRTVAEIRRDRGDAFIEGTEQLRVPLNYGALAPDGSVTNNGTGNDNGNGISNQSEANNAA